MASIEDKKPPKAISSTDSNYLDYEDEWAADDSPGQELCVGYRLGRGRPLMFSQKIIP